MNEIKNNSELEVGKYYHCYLNSTGHHSIHKCYGDYAEPKYISNNRIWADDGNNQALEKWKILGPIKTPKIDTIGLCQKHHGHGFISDCAVCNSDA